jgi:hypothetical protein
MMAAELEFEPRRCSNFEVHEQSVGYGLSSHPELCSGSAEEWLWVYGW